MNMREHTSHDVEVELAAVRRRILEMGRHVDSVLESSGRALLEHHGEIGNRVVIRDQRTDSMELDIDRLCPEILACLRAVAGDLRLLTSALKLVEEIRRLSRMRRSDLS